MAQRSLPMTPTNLERVLDGTKTETRRVASAKPGGTLVPGAYRRGTFDLDAAWVDPGFADDDGEYRQGYLHAPLLSAPGWSPAACEGVVDRLYPRWEPGDLGHIGEALVPWGAWEKHRYEVASYERDDELVLDDAGEAVPWRWKVRKLNGRYCPLAYRRAWVRVSHVWVERLQDITVEGALAEGVDGDVHLGQPDALDGTVGEVVIGRFRRLWDSINAARGFGWETNLWVVAVRFQLVSTTGRPA